jgi:two-component system alkaline phosphatase synthesis response regulator PhoP
MSGPRRVLIADDHHMIVDLLRSQLEDAGYLVLTQMAPERVLETVISERPALVVLDAQMPPRERFFALRELAVLEPPDRPAVIVLSGHDEPAIRELALALGADGFLPKPWDREELCSLTERLIGSADPRD